MTACDFVCKKHAVPFSGAPPKMNLVNRVLRVFPRGFVMNFSGLRQVTMKHFFNFVSGGMQTVSN